MSAEREALQHELGSTLEQLAELGQAGEERDRLRGELEQLQSTLVEVSDFQAVFPAPTESAEDAIGRVQPTLVLVDCDAGDETRCLEPVEAYGGSVILFSPWRGEAEVRRIAARHGLPYFSLPIAWVDFRTILRTAARLPHDG